MKGEEEATEAGIQYVVKKVVGNIKKIEKELAKKEISYEARVKLRKW